MKKISSDNILKFMQDNGMVNVEDVLSQIETMKNQEILNQHPYAISQGSNKRWYTYLPDISKPNGRRQIAKSSKEKVEKEVIQYYRQREKEETQKKLCLKELYICWMHWRKENGTDAKTIQENQNEWKRFLENHPLSNKNVVDLEMSDIESFFLDITVNHSITYKRMTNVKSLLNGVFKHAVRLKLIEHSPMAELDYKQFRTRCKPTNPPKKNYTEEERRRIITYLDNKTDIYSLSIQLAFFLCLRIGEIISLKKEDVDFQLNRIYIRRSCRRRQEMNEDLTFGKRYFDIEERIKGNQREGFRFIPLTPQAQKLLKKILELYPEGEYLFMRYGKPILADTFNRHLKQVCKDLEVEYRSSHQIRFTMATMFYDGGIKVNELSNFLGHSDTKTTFHYIRQQQATEKTANLMKDILDV